MLPTQNSQLVMLGNGITIAEERLKTFDISDPKSNLIKELTIAHPACESIHLTHPITDNNPDD